MIKPVQSLIFFLACMLPLGVQAEGFTTSGKSPNVVHSEKTSTGTLSGIITDEQNQSLPGVTLRLDKYNRYTISSLDGKYVFLNLPVGEYVLSISYMGFQPFSTKVKVQKGKNTELKIKLKEKVYKTGELVVIGEMLRGQRKALNTEKSNVNLTNMVAADQIGRFPDANIGDALKRIPGITMQNDQGEARDIVVRGLAPELNSVTLNGNRIPSAEGDNRRVQMDLIPADMVSMVEVSKTLLSDMDADAIGGSVNLVTRRAPHRTRLSVTLGGGYNPIRSSGTYNGALVFGKRFLKDRIGMVFSASYQDKDYGSDNVEAVWGKTSKGDAFVSQFDIRKYDVRRVRQSYSLALDYKFNPSHEVKFGAVYNRRKDYENRFRARWKGATPKGEEVSASTEYTGELRRETKGGGANVRNRRLEDQQVFSLSLDGTHLWTKALQMEWGLSYSKASEDRPNERYIDYSEKKIKLSENLSDGLYPILTPIGYSETENKMKLRKITENHNFTSEDEWTINLKFRTPLSLLPDQKGRLRFGSKVRIKNKLRDNVLYSYKPAGEFSKWADVPAQQIEISSFVHPDGRYSPGRFVSTDYLGSLDLNNSALFTKKNEYSEYIPLNYTARENIYSGYFRWDQNVSKDFLLVAGLRAEYTDITYTGNTLVNGTEGKARRDGNKYLNLFPNLTFKYQATPQFLLRGAYSTALSRPNYYWLVPYTLINTNDSDLGIGNPKLKPTYSHNFDLLSSYYFGNVGLISAGLFYKKITNFIYKYKTNTLDGKEFAQMLPDLENPIPAGEQWKFSQHRNGSKVDLYGVELSLQRSLDFLPTSFLKKFAIYLNYTYTHSRAEGITTDDGTLREKVSLPGSAPHMANASLAWENKWLSMRLSMNHASSYLDALGGEAFEDSYYGAQTFLDFNMNAKVGKGLSLFFEANNLTNQPLFYYQGQKDRLQQVEYYKPTFTGGIKWNL